MSRNTSISLSGHFETFVDRLVSTGNYHSVSEVVRAGLRLLEEQELRVQRLREALIAGENSGKLQPFHHELLKQEMFSCAEVMRILHQSMDSDRQFQDN